MAEAPLLEVRDIGKAFGGVRAVAGVSFTLWPGEMRAVIGPNGAGKTTLFNLLTGQLACDHGRILFRGEEIGGLPSHRIARKGIGRTFQVPAAFRSLTVRENVQAALLAREGRSRDMLSQTAIGRVDAAAGALLTQVGIAGLAGSGCGTLSLSDLKRLEFSLALAGEPSLLLLDEPTAGMSVAERTALMALVNSVVRERGLTVLFTEHDMEVVFASATRILVMHQGRVLAEGNPREVQENRDVQQVYLGMPLED
jgi:branched-chain amino acid transport system ATP-binding protein